LQDCIIIIIIIIIIIWNDFIDGKYQRTGLFEWAHML
jgi:hypothetical protein